MKKEQRVRFIKLGNLAKKGKGITAESEMITIHRQHSLQFCDNSEESEDDLLLCERNVTKRRRVSCNTSLCSTASCVSSLSLCKKSVKVDQNLIPVKLKPITAGVNQPGTSAELRFQNRDKVYDVYDHRINGHSSTNSDHDQSENDDIVGADYGNDQDMIQVNCTWTDKYTGEQSDEQMEESNQAESISPITAEFISEKEHRFMFEMNNNGMNNVHLIKDLKIEDGTYSEREKIEKYVTDAVIRSKCLSEVSKSNSVHSEKHMTSPSYSSGLLIRYEQRMCSVPGLGEVSSEKLFMELKQRHLLFLCVCGAGFLDEQLFRDHKLCHTLAAPMMCACCCQEFSDGFLFNKHLIQHLCNN